MTIEQFKNHMMVTLENLMDDMEANGEYSERFNLEITLNKKTLNLPLHADLFSRLENLLTEEQKENEL